MPFRYTRHCGDWSASCSDWILQSQGKGGAVPKPAKKGPKNTDEDKALSAREAARKRVEARTLNNFGFQ